MTKERVVELMKENGNMESKAAAERVLEAILECVKDELIAGKSVALRPFGNFTVIERKARQGRNPRTKELMNIPASKSVKFVAGKELKSTAKAMETVTGQILLSNKKFTRNMERKLKEAKKTFDGYVSKPEKLSKDARKIYNEQMKKVKPKYEDAKKRLKELSSHSGDAWGEMKTGFEKAYSELKDAFQKAKKKL